MKLNPDISAIVTGGASGLGEATARMLAQEGVRVAIFDRDPTRGGEVAQSIGATFCEVDVTSAQAVERGFERARTANGQERIFVNCAGHGGSMKTVRRDRETGEIQLYAMDNFERIVALNLVGAFRCLSISAGSMASLDRLETEERGMIVNTASAAAVDGQVGQCAYSAAKAGIVGMTLPIARDLASEGIRINTIMPGLFETPLVARMAPAVKAGLSTQIQFPKRLGVPDEFAEMVRAIAACTYLNGEAIRLDGALRMAAR